MASIPRAIIAELVGTYAFFTIGAGAVVVATSPSTEGAIGLLGIAAAHGLALSVMVTIFAGISGGHFNPAVTIGVLAGRKIGVGRAVGYIGAQLLAAAAAGWTLRVFFDRADWEPSHLGTPALASGVSVNQAIVIEAVLTFFLVLAVWGTGVDPRGAVVGGFGIGLTVFADILVGGPLTGAAMNPARHFGPALLSNFWSDWWIYWAGPMLGGILAGVLYRGVFWDEETDVPPAVAAGATQPRD